MIIEDEIIIFIKKYQIYNLLVINIKDYIKK